jgi:hypothetical protein
MQQGNRRKQPRLVTNLKVNYRLGSRTGSAYTLDVGAGGAFVQTSDRATVGEWIQLIFSVSVAGERKSVQCIGQVRRVLGRDEAAATGLLPGFAVEFRKFLQGLEDLREFLASRLGLSLEQVGHPSLGPVPDHVSATGRDSELSPRPTAHRAVHEPAAAGLPGPSSPSLESVVPLHAPRAAVHDAESVVIPIAPPPSPFEQPERLGADLELEGAEPFVGTTDRPEIDLQAMASIAVRTAAVVAALVVISWILQRLGLTSWDLVPWG